ncbi:hypothetical protein CBW52_22565 [Yersinia kristensenii]|uniref:Uncharacterized protein n=1 Tax=Yersinia kristensenii TaxID=28152 RepID=A0AB73NU37_YERKR|nr:hypothetical protein CBW52_22565 [Yersinia kristensenii]
MAQQDKPILLHWDWRGDCTDGRSDGLRRYDPFGTFPRLSTLSAVWRSLTRLRFLCFQFMY